MTRRPGGAGAGPVPPVAIVVLGAAVWDGGRPSPTLDRRIARAARAAEALPVVPVIGSGGLGRHAPSEARVIRQGLIARGIAPERILEEDRSTSTLENALFTRRILAGRGVTRVLVVTDSYHMPRALMTFRLLGLRARGCPVWRRDPGWGWVAAHLREAAALPWYLGRILWNRRALLSDRD